MYSHIGKYEKALENYRKCPAIQEKNLGKTHSDYVTTLTNIGVIYFRYEKYG